MQYALEVVIYKTKADVNSDDFIRESEMMENGFAKLQKGFIKRTFAKSEQNDWIDVLYWETMQDTINASEAAMKSPTCAPMFQMLEPSSIKMHHFNILS